MTTSRLIEDILDLSLDGDEIGRSLRPQIPFLNDADYNYTGVGLYVYFKQEAGIEQCKCRQSECVLDRLELTSAEFEGIAETMVFVVDHFVSYVEIWSRIGRYPLKELSHYTLTQAWLGEAGRRVVR